MDEPAADSSDDESLDAAFLDDIVLYLADELDAADERIHQLEVELKHI